MRLDYKIKRIIGLSSIFFCMLASSGKVFAQTINLPPCDDCTNATETGLCEVSIMKHTDHNRDISGYDLGGLYINGEGKLISYGENRGTYGYLGTSYTENNDDLPFHGVRTFYRHLEAPNTKEFLPDVNFARVHYYSNVVFLLSEDGRLFSYDDFSKATSNAADFEAISGRPDNTPASEAIALTPYEILAPNGQPWVDIAFRERRNIAYACAGDDWYVWGNDRESTMFLSTSTSGITVYEPTLATILNNAGPGKPVCNAVEGTFNPIDDIDTTWTGIDGNAYLHSNSTGYAVVPVPLPANVKPVHHAGSVTGGHIVIVGDDGNIYRVTNTNPVTVILDQRQPSGVNFINAEVGGLSSNYVVALTDTGDAWYWFSNTTNASVPSPNPVLVPGNNATDFVDLFVDRNNFVQFIKSTGEGWGYLLGRFDENNQVPIDPSLKADYFLGFSALDSAGVFPSATYQSCNPNEVAE